MRTAAESRRIRALRPPRSAVDPFRLLDLLIEEEPDGRGGGEPALTVFLAGAECPFTCVFCDLWRHTLPGPTPPGAIPRQLELALERLHGGLGGRRWEPWELARIKLYNASNFFDPRAVPPVDEPRILELLAPFREVTVECHPRLLGARAQAFAARLEGRLEVAMGLETIHPEAFERLNKGMTLEDFEAAAGALRSAGIGVRAFVLVGAPFVPPEEAASWAAASALWAFEKGAERVSLIPVRGGEGEMERLCTSGWWTKPTLGTLEEALEEALRRLAAAPAPGGRRVVTADPWDLETFARCSECLPARRRRLQRISLSGRPEPPVPCGACGYPGQKG